jgi:hypothetical protein
VTDNAVWTAGLGARPGAEPPPVETDDAPFEHRIVDAATAPSIVPPGAVSSPFSHPYQVGAGSAAPSPITPVAAFPQKETTTMAKQDTERATAPRNLQMRVGALLLEKGALTYGAIHEEFSDLTSKQLYQSLFQMKAAQRAKKVATPAGEVWQITPFGKAWVKQGGGRASKLAAKAEPPKAAPAKAVKPRKAAKKAKAAKPVPAKRPRIPARKTRRAPKAEGAALAAPAPSTSLAVRAFEPVVERSFRCAVYSDGAFHLAKNGQSIDLTAAEFAEMLRYQERMVEVNT